MRNFSRWLPADTRTVEFASGAAFVVSSIAIALGLALAPMPVLSWALMLFCLGFLQVVSAGFELRILQTITSIICGSIWIYTAASGINYLQSTDIAAWFLGFSNLYAFILHSTKTTGIRP